MSILNLAQVAACQLHKKLQMNGKKTTGVTIKEAYGLSEMSPAVTINRLDDDEFNTTVGYHLPSTLVSIRDLKGNILSTDQKGEIWVKGPQQSPGFWQMDQVTKEHFTTDGWLKTGDIGFLDKMSRLSISGRCKNMLIVSGFNVFPKEVENVILKMPKVKDVAVIGVPSQHSGEKPRAFVVLEKDTALTADEITEFC